MKITKEKCLEDIADVLYGKRTRFGTPAVDTAVETANTACRLFASHWVSPLAMRGADRADAHELWYCVALSHVMQLGGWTYEDVCKNYGPAIAGETYLITPDLRMPAFERVRWYTIALGQAKDSIKVGALAATLATIRQVQKHLKRAPELGLWELATYVRQLRASTCWSQRLQEEWKKCADIVNVWFASGKCSQNLANPYTHWSLTYDGRKSNIQGLLS